MLFRHLPKPASFNFIYERMLSKWLLESSDTPTIIAFTSRMPHEGVSTVVAGLARTMGAADPGRVLVLDTSPSNRRIAKLLNVSQGTSHNIKKLSVKHSNLDNFITSSKKYGVDILTLTEAKHTTSSSARSARALLERLPSHYGTILVDAGALNNGKSNHWLASSDYRILVVDATKATHEILKRQRKELEHSGITMDGSILNKRTYHIPKMFYWLVH